MSQSNINRDRILSVFDRKGIAKRKRASLMAEILNVHNQTARQKLDLRRGISYEELKRVYAYFNEPLDNFRGYNGLFIVNERHMRCNVEVIEEELDFFEPDTDYAFKRNGLFIINPKARQFGREARKVKKIDLLPSPRIAILDNDEKQTDMLTDLTNRLGIEAKVFVKEDELLRDIKRNTYECYVLEWKLEGGGTTEQTLSALRKADEKVPVLLFTGHVSEHENVIGDLIIDYAVELVEKPARMKILSSQLIRHLFY